MQEIKRKVVTYEYDMRCDKCEEGFMRPTGAALMSYPIQYPHKCNKCGYETNYYVTYPDIRNSYE